MLQSHGMVKEGREEQSNKVIGAEKDGMRSDGEISEGCGEELSLTEVRTCVCACTCVCARVLVCVCVLPVCACVCVSCVRACVLKQYTRQ